MYYHNPYQSAPQNGRPVQMPGQGYGYGQYSSVYPGNVYAEPARPVYPSRPDAVTVPAPAVPASPAPAPAPAAPVAPAAPTAPIGGTDAVPWTNQSLAQIFIRPQEYTAAASAEETLRMGTTFPELFKPFNPGGKN